MDSSRLFGRTSFGTQEILQKSGRLTQSERLVLIVLGDQIAFPALLGKLSALSPERIDQALVRLIELNLAYEIVAPTPEAAVTATIPVNALRTFLAQSDSDPVTVMASAEQKEATAHARALNASVGQVIDSAVARAQARVAPVAVPLGKLFPGNAGSEGWDGSGAATVELGPARLSEAARSGGAISTGLDSITKTTGVAADSAVQDFSPATQDPGLHAEFFRDDGPSSGGDWTLVVGGMAAVAVIGALLIYLLR